MIDLNQLAVELEAGYIRKQTHPTHPYSIYNYTPKTQIDQHWTELTLQCRGLILDDAGAVISRPLTKFFNYAEWLKMGNSIPNEPYTLDEKYDGSLGITYWIDNQVYLASRGSFTSDQAQKANELLTGPYAPYVSLLKTDYTYCFEIIYPQNRIVCQYGSLEQLVLLAVIHTETGTEADPDMVGWPDTRIQYSFDQPLELLHQLELDNKEGFVVRFASGFRLKIKFGEYLRLHKLLTGASTKTLWEYLSQNRPVDELLADVPDEFYGWVKQETARLQRQYDQIEINAQEAIQLGKGQNLPSRKEWAAFIKTQTYPAICFLMLDDRNYSDAIWKLCKPVYEKPFNQLLLDDNG